MTSAVDLYGVLTVYVWDSSADGWGHAAVMLDDGTYISWWPGTDLDGKFKGGDGPWNNIYDALHEPDRSFEADKKDESGELWSKKIDGLDEDSIRKWWDEFSNDDDNLWSTFSQNCSTVAAEALKRGGASTEWWDMWNGWNVIWTPGDVRRFAEAIAE